MSQVQATGNGTHVRALQPGKQVSNGFNSRLFWPDIVYIPVNSWIFTCKDIIDKLGTDRHAAAETKHNMEKCLLYFYTVKKTLNLFDHTYTAACILFFRYWYIYGLPPSLPSCIHISQAILVTACKTTENNRPVDAYAKVTCEFISKSLHGNKAVQNIDKLKWDIRDKLVENEKRMLCMFGFDLNIGNPKELLEEIFSGYYRYNRDYNLPDDFKQVLPKLLQEARVFIVQAMTQPVALLCDEYTFVALSLIYCGLQYKRLVDKNFRYPPNFFKNKFPIVLDPQKLEDTFTDYRILEDNFFDLKSNKKDKLEISKEEIASIIQEEGEKESEGINDPYSYELIKDGEVRQELLDHTEKRLQDMLQKAKDASNMKRASSESHRDQENTAKRQKT